jgi:hypothetical protein
MNAKSKFQSTAMLLGASLLLISPASRADVEATQAPNGVKVTKIKVNGRFAYALLNDGETKGFLNASKDEITNTSALDFAYAYPNPANSDFVVLVQGAGEIPNSAFTITATSAGLSVTTPFPIIRCDVNLIDASFFCDYTTPSTFEVTWTADGFGSVVERTQRTETFGPVSIRSQGEYTERSATVNQKWDGHFNADATGNLLDTRGITFLREVALQRNR